ncbi:hypothetical protein DSO57_1005965 [Entomophthora muscae]|uniref:Uncharacterized protein n=1 Tax=Entomophthora muscae TaxID=34485 RepID=A0ACC2TVI6_9FUNG|nr:hypothetical protein DSO57_1005965 [Entomophthora muscae]
MQVDGLLPRLAMVVVGTSAIAFLAAIVKAVLKQKTDIHGSNQLHSTLHAPADCARMHRRRIIQFTRTTLLQTHQPIKASASYFEVHILNLPPNSSLLVGLGPRASDIGNPSSLPMIDL